MKTCNRGECVVVICDEIVIDGHPNIYNNSSRKLRIAYGIPETTNNETGIILLVPGFGGNIDSNVYKKMRREFPEKYNSVVVQCSYFGDEFMQTPKNFNMDISQVIKEKRKDSFTQKEILEVFEEEKYIIHATEFTNESIESFNDMGYMQAIDLLTTIACMEFILKGNNIVYNPLEIIGYGHSHGAYLLYLANFLNGNIFSLIVDNSGWIIPSYLQKDWNRRVITKIGKSQIITSYDYWIVDKIINMKIYDLKELYKNKKPNVLVYSFLGEDDELVSLEEKKEFINMFPNGNLEIISNKNIDNIIFNNTKHSLGADLLKLFEYVMGKSKNRVIANRVLKKEYEIESLNLRVKYDGVELPLFNFEKCLLKQNQ